MADQPTHAHLPAAVLAKLRCPRTGAPLEQQGPWLVARTAGLALRYPFKDGIAVLLPDAGEPLEPPTPGSSPEPQPEPPHAV